MLRKDGETAWVEVSGALIEWAGRPASLNFLSDIQVDDERIVSKGQDWFESVCTAMVIRLICVEISNICGIILIL